MDFFNTLTLDLKILAVAMVGFAVLALFSGNRTSEKRYMVILAVLTAIGVYRFMHFEQADQSTVASSTPQHLMKARDQHKPLESTAAGNK